MKGFIKTGNIITMTLATMGIFASCGDSEIFDEPTMYQTRALNFNDNSNESYREVIKEGNKTLVYNLFNNNVNLEIRLEWGHHPNGINYVENYISVDFANSNYFSFQMGVTEHRLVDDDTTVEYTYGNFSVKEVIRNSQGDPIDTVRHTECTNIEDYKTGTFTVEKEKLYFDLYNINKYKQ